MNNRVEEDDKAKRSLKIKPNRRLTLTKLMLAERTAAIKEVASGVEMASAVEVYAENRNLGVQQPSGLSQYIVPNQEETQQHPLNLTDRRCASRVQGLSNAPK